MPSHEAADPFETSTRPASPTVPSAADTGVPALTILYHPEPERVGERVVLSELVGGGPAALSRLEPLFAPIRHGAPRPLGDPHLSRRPFKITPTDAGGLLVDASGTSTLLLLDGELMATQRRIPAERLAEGSILLLARRIALVLHTLPLRPPATCAPELLGESGAMTQVRREIERVADLAFPVLLRGETGTGKELVARAIHEAGPRRARPYLALNVGAVPAELAAAELFGAAKGAYTGAHRQRQGFFQRAAGGTLFLDEIGVTTQEVQVLLLRALESGQVQPVGGEKIDVVDVRIVSATDADLEAAVAEGDFRSPLLHRLAAYEIALPPLRARRDDIGRLFFAFLHDELAAVGEHERLADASPWIDAELVSRLALYSWPGNVRQLKNVVRQLVVASRGAAGLQVPASVERLLGDATANSPAIPTISAGSSYRQPAEISDDELLAALRAEEFIVSRAAQRLCMSKTALYKRMDGCPLVRKASELERSEIENVRRRHMHDSGENRGDDLIRVMAAELEVSSRGLRLRMRQFGLL